tara:strand:- start:125 stop:580 length:456 start_codon:yes stop_codon:yes gene_type:complete
MTYHLSSRSLARLEGVKPELASVVQRAIKLSSIDFGVIEGVRSEQRQAELVASGASQTMKSRHLTGDAVDLLAYVAGRPCWELQVYDAVATAVREAALQSSTSIRWGAAWTVPDICDWYGSLEAAMASYIDTRRKAGRRPFLDGPHFELIG